LLRGETAKVLATLESTTSTLLYSPGVVATRAALYEKLGDLEGAARMFENTVTWYEQQNDQGDTTEEAYIKILRASGDFKLKHKKYEQAVQIYEKLLRKNRNDVLTLPALVIAASHCNPALAEQYESRIPAVGGNAVVDADALENLPAPRFAGKQDSTTTEAKKKEGDERSKKTKKKKKKLLPKNHNPAVPPDPERWLPKWQRSYFKKKQRKGVLGKGPQGLSLPQATAVLGTPTTTTAPTTTKQTPVATQAQVRAAASKNSKKKGRKG